MSELGYQVVDGEWKPTPAWQVRWLGRKPYRQFHNVFPSVEPMGWYIYADAPPPTRSGAPE